MLLDESLYLRVRLIHAFSPHARLGTYAFICTEMAAVRALASNGLGLAVMPRSVAEEPGPPIELRPFAPERLTWPVALVWRAARRQSAAGNAFLKVALEYARRPERPNLRAA
jgi:DNA-binding transcriptional LysR family regulator